MRGAERAFTVMRSICAVALMSLAGCASTTDHYAGSDVPLASESPPAGAAAPDSQAASAGTVAVPIPPASDAGPMTTAQDAAQAPADAPPVCAAGSDDCDGVSGNGCEADLLRDPAHCGVCNHGCTGPGCACEDGSFIATCEAGYADCDGDAQNGCETDTSSDLAHCGGCARPCHDDGYDANAAACTAGRCELTCRSPLFEIDCDGDPDNGCETNIWVDAENCGGCGVQCSCRDGRCL
jgi:hypothetical protein